MQGLQDPTSYAVTETSAQCFYSMLSCLHQRVRTRGRSNISTSPTSRLPRPHFALSRAGSASTAVSFPAILDEAPDEARLMHGTTSSRGGDKGGARQDPP